jgi:hypothetical protein
VAAVHQATDAFAYLAAADATAVTRTDQAGRLYVPTRTLPDSYNVPRRYATTPLQRTGPLLEAYTTAAQASAQATTALAGLARTIGAPSATLALARAACTPHQPPGPSQPASAAVTGQPPTRTATPGPVEQAIQQLHLNDPALLLRAAAIDQAARQLLAQAEQTAPPPSPHAQDTTAHQRPGNAAQLAASDCPAGLAIKPPSSNHGNRTAARPPTGPSPRPPRRPPTRSQPQPRRTR